MTFKQRFYLGSGKCPSRNVEAQRIYNYLIRNGWESTDSVQDADLVILSTCASKDRAAEASLDTMSRLYKAKSDSAPFLVTGCLPLIDRDAVREFEGLQLISPRELEKIDLLFDHHVKLREVPEPNIITVPDVTKQDSFKWRVPYRIELSIPFLRFCYYRIMELFRDKTDEGPFFNLKLGTGCLGECSYCAIKFVTGKMISRDPDTLIEEFRRGLVSKYRYFNFVGQDTGAYGLDIQSTFVELLESVLKFEGNYKLAIQDFNAWWLFKYFDELMSLSLEHREKFAEIRIPIQSGSDRILRLMKRPYRVADLKEMILQIRKRISELRIESHIMVGFPSETEEDFECSRQLLEELNLDRVGVFIYDDRPFTEASRMAD